MPSPSSIPARAQPSYDEEEDGPQFVLALLTDHGAWKADLPVTASQVLGKESVFTAGQGNSRQLQLPEILTYRPLAAGLLATLGNSNYQKSLQATGSWAEQL